MKEKGDATLFYGPSYDQLLAADTVQADAESALINLGYRPIEVYKAIKRSRKKLDETPNLELIIREALKELAKC